jgi:two-component system sensor histidine kinase EvgS
MSGLAALPSAELGLSEHEREWLQAHSTVSFTGDPNWLPYEAFDKNGNYIGIVSEYLKLIATMTGLEFKMSPSKTWTESTEKAKQGLVDVLSETDDSVLQSSLNFTTPYISNPLVIVMESRKNYVENINQIKKQKIALIKDYGYADKIRKKYSNIKFITVDDIQDGLLSVSTGDVDALICTLALCSYTIAELGLNNVKITGKTEFNTKLALGVQKNLPELLSILNKAISRITPEQKQVILEQWVKNKFVEKTDYTLVFQVVDYRGKST